MKKIFIFALCLLFCFSGCAANGEWNALELARRDAASDASIPAQHVAVALSPASDLQGLEMTFTVTGESPSVTVSVYRAEKDYNTTLSGKPLREKNFSNLAEKVLWQFRSLPAGDYLIVFSDLSAATLTKSVVPSDEANGKILYYRNGEVMTDGTPVLTLLCAKNGEESPKLVTFSYPVPQE